LVRDLLDNLKFNEFVGEQAERPASLAFGWFTAGKGNQMSLMSSLELALILAAWSTAMEGGLKTLLTELFADTSDGGLADLNGFGNGMVDPSRPIGALIGFEEDTSVHEQTSGRSACGNQALKVVAFNVGQDDWVFLIHHRSIPTTTLQIKSRVTDY
jgi:hypothetical protein